MSEAIGAFYPEREDAPEQGLIGRAGSALAGSLQRVWKTRWGRERDILRRVAPLGEALTSLDRQGLREQARELTMQLRLHGLRDDLVAQAFALVRETAQREVGMRHFDSQLIGGWVLLHGMIAEMETGEGKTLMATLPACTAAMAGRPVHIITVNDYLVARDHALMRPVYAALGLSSAAVTSEMSHEARQLAYASDIVYCSNKTVVFDYLRDRIVLGSKAGSLRLTLDRMYGEKSRTGKLLLRGLCFAIVDEVDSVLADEAATPLIISAPVPGAHEDEGLARQALSLADALVEGADYEVLSGDRRIEMRPAGLEHAIALSGDWGGVWNLRLRREELVVQALSAMHLFRRDEHYLVTDGEVQIVDEFTGRVMPDRSWNRGLHQLIEAKEGCALTVRREPLARISYQRFFRRYLHLSGMSGTARELTREFGAVYGLAVVTVPTHRPSQRRWLADRVLDSESRKWDCVLEVVLAHHARGAPVLVGTRSVAASERLSARLADCGVAHRLLNARQDRTEGEVVALAGQPGQITIATNMAGRGTDIQLGSGVAELGGLHVILTERHEAGRIDRQLAGRCARQGDPGNVQAILSLEDALLQTFGSTQWARWVCGPGEGGRARWIRWVQWRVARAQSGVRRKLLAADRQMGVLLSFSGRPE